MSIIVSLILMGIMGFFIYRIITPACYLILFIYWAYHDRKHRPFSDSKPKEWKGLIEELKHKETREYVRDCFFNKGLSIQKIGEKLKNDFSIEIFISTGLKAGDFKSQRLFETLYEILGFNTESEYWDWVEGKKKKR